jgi:hypothetical protein
MLKVKRGAVMGLRVRRSIKVFPGFTINVSKTGVSASVGVSGAKVTVSKKGARKTVGLPSTGISLTEYQPHAGCQKAAPPQPSSQSFAAIPRPVQIVGAIFILFALYGWYRIFAG